MRQLFSLFFFLIAFTSIAQEKITKSEDEWRNQLTEMEYYVIRKKGTEAPNTGKYNKHYKNGIYTCKACDLELFDSKNKYNSHSGWPSFNDALKKAVATSVDNSHGMQRTEILCARCDGHLGHVFNDGPAPTGLRYCVNSVSLNFKQK